MMKGRKTLSLWFEGVKRDFRIDALPRLRRAKASVMKPPRVMWPRPRRLLCGQGEGGDAAALPIQPRTRGGAADGWLTSGS